MSNVITNDGKHIQKIIDATPCDKHQADLGMPCWGIYPEVRGNKVASALCNKRIKAHGYNGKITVPDFQMKRFAPTTFRKKN